MVQYGEPDKPFPRYMKPMDCLMTAKLPHGDGWVYEVKWDGYRCIAVRDGKDALLFSDAGNSHTEKFPGIVLALKQLPSRRFALDGEIVALDDEGKPDFQALQNWRTTGQPIVYYVFDVLHLGGRDLIDLPLSDRRKALERLASGFTEPIRLSPQFHVELEDFVRSVREQGLEGVVAKRLTSRYEVGKRSGSWQKQRFGMTEKYLVGGFLRASRGVGELLLGEWRGKKFYYTQRVRAGLVPHTREMLLQALEKWITPDCPFFNLPEKPGPHTIDAARMKECVWVKPRTWVEVEFVNRTVDGKMRHPKFRRVVN